MKSWAKKIKKLDLWDLKLMKLTSMAFILLLVKIIPGLMDLLHSIDWYWFLIATIVFAIRPIKKCWF